MSDAFDLLHPDVQRKLWEMKWTELRPIQSAAIRHVSSGGGDCIIASPTASGKTEAAFLPILSSIAASPASSVRAMYVGPLKALINDQFRRVEELCERLAMAVHKWHGDVGAAARRRLLDAPSGVLLITPESLEAMFVRRPTRLPAIFAHLSFVVVDEMHAFMGSERGAQLISQLHRLHRRTGSDPVRIGLSATLGDPARAQAWLRPNGPRAHLIEDTSGASPIATRVSGIWKMTPPRPGRGESDKAQEDEAADEESSRTLGRTILLAVRGKTNLVFANKKSRIEELADSMTTEAEAMQLVDEIVVHHGSLSKEKREYAEERLRAPRPCTAVCSNTLELGIDIGEIDEVVQVSAPWSVSSLVQRLGRSGRRANQRRVLRAYFVEDAPTERSDVWDRLHLDFLQGIAIVDLMFERFLEPPATGRAHLSTLIHQVLSVLAETGGCPAVVLFGNVADSCAFGKISRADFAVVLRELGKHELIEQMADGTLVLAEKGLALVEHYTFFAAFNAPDELRVVHRDDTIGTVAQPPAPGEHLILAGRRWRVDEIDAEQRQVLVTPARGRRPPLYVSRGALVHPKIHGRMRELLRGTDTPTFLDEGAREILASARQTTAHLDGLSSSVRVFDDGVRLFAFGGTRVQQTLALVFLRAGLEALDYRVGFDVNGRPDRVADALATFAAAPDPVALATYADERLQRRKLGPEKFDALVPPVLWGRAYVDEQLDIAGAAAAARGMVEDIQRMGTGHLLRGDRPRNAAQPRVNGCPVAPIHPIGSPTRLPHNVSNAEHRVEATMKPLVGWGLGGPCVRPQAPGESARLGEPTWSPAQLLRDLELRLGLPQGEQSAAVRVPSWSKRLAVLAGTSPFYARSFTVDSLGTAKTLLAWRDALVDAGWNGQAIDGGGDRLEAMAALEALGDAEPLPVGRADRLVGVERELRTSSKHRIYDGLVLVEDRALWSLRWRSIFTLLEERGTRIEQLTPKLATAPAETDLGILQQMLRGERPSRRSGDGSAVKGDGTLLVLRGDTPADLAELTAALLVKHREGASVVRCADAEALETALARHGLPQQGHDGSSVWRPAMQILPLALELAYEPRDPYRVLELLTLPIGPFQGILGRQLARAVSKQPGVGGTEWLRQKEKAVELLRASRLRRRAAEGMAEADAALDVEAYVTERMGRLAEWIEAPGANADGAPRTSLLAVAKRVSTFLQMRLAASEQSELYGAAFSQARAMADVLAREDHDLISREDMRHLLDSVVRGAEGHALSIEGAGRIDHVHHPAALLAPSSTVVYWAFVAGTERPSLPPWHRAERVALEAAGVAFPDPGKLLSVESESWRRGILAASERVIVVIPSTIKGTATAPHPTWDEIAARLGLEDEKAAGFLTRSPLAILGGREEALVPLATLAPLPLPEGRREWMLPPLRIAADGELQTSATALDVLASCPLRFVLEQHAHLRSGALAKVADGARLNGNLGHRLVEELHRENGFELEDDELHARATAVLGALLKTEGATLLLDGASFERAQFIPQLVRAMLELRRYFTSSGWRIAAVEESVETSSALGTLRGRLDVRLVNDEGQQAVLDLKWGEATYRELLEGGRAVQLAAYVRAIHTKGGKHSLPPAGYYALSTAKVLSADARMSATKMLEGPTLEDTWRRVEKTARTVQASLREGKVHVAATKRALPLLEALGVPESEREAHYTLREASDVCTYCDYPTICGKAWEAVR